MLDLWALLSSTGAPSIAFWLLLAVQLSGKAHEDSDTTAMNCFHLATIAHSLDSNSIAVMEPALSKQLATCFILY